MRWPLAKKYSCYIVIKYQNHQHNQEKQTDLLSDFSDFDTDRAALDCFDKKKQQVTAIQHRYGQSRLIMAKLMLINAIKEIKLPTPALAVPGHLSNHDRTAQGVGGDITFDQLGNNDHHQLGNFVCLDQTL